MFTSALPDLRAVVGAVGAGQGDKTYVVYEDERVHVRRDRTRRCRSLAAHLTADLGIGRGDRVALAMRNYPEWVIGHWATSPSAPPSSA